MSRYDTYTRFDDRKLEEQELGFKGFNDRLLESNRSGNVAKKRKWKTRPQWSMAVS